MGYATIPSPWDTVKPPSSSGLTGYRGGGFSAPNNIRKIPTPTNYSAVGESLARQAQSEAKAAEELGDLLRRQSVSQYERGRAIRDFIKPTNRWGGLARGGSFASRAIGILGTIGLVGLLMESQQGNVANWFDSMNYSGWGKHTTQPKAAKGDNGLVAGKTYRILYTCTRTEYGVTTTSTGYVTPAGQQTPGVLTPPISFSTSRIYNYQINLVVTGGNGSITQALKTQDVSATAYITASLVALERTDGTSQDDDAKQGDTTTRKNTNNQPQQPANPNPFGKHPRQSKGFSADGTPKGNPTTTPKGDNPKGVNPDEVKETANTPSPIPPSNTPSPIPPTFTPKPTTGQPSPNIAPNSSYTDSQGNKWETRSSSSTSGSTTTSNKQTFKNGQLVNSQETIENSENGTKTTTFKDRTGQITQIQVTDKDGKTSVYGTISGTPIDGTEVDINTPTSNDLIQQIGTVAGVGAISAIIAKAVGDKVAENIQAIEDNKNAANILNQSPIITSGGGGGGNCSYPAFHAQTVAERAAIKADTSSANTTLGVVSNIQATVTNVGISEINGKLGTPIMEGVTTVFEGMNKAQTFMQNFSKSLYLDRVYNALSLLLQIHNAAQLSRSLVDSISFLLESGADILHLKKEDESEINISQMIGGTIENFLKGALGESTYNGLNATWKKTSAIYTSAVNVYELTLNSMSGIAEGLQTVGSYTGRIGNALKKGGVILEDAYQWMDENVRVKTGRFAAVQKITDGLQNATEITDNLTEVTETIQETTENVTQIQSEFNSVKSKITEKETAKNTTETTVKANSQSADIPKSDYP